MADGSDSFPNKNIWGDELFNMSLAVPLAILLIYHCYIHIVHMVMEGVSTEIH